MPSPLLAPLLRWLGGMSHPRLFLLMALLFVVNVVVPDPFPLVDELLLGLAALVFANWKKGREARPPLDRQGRRD